MKKEYTLELMLDFGENGKKMIPVVTQDYNSKDVLILSFANKEAFEKTIEIGYATYWSRSRNELWIKGLTSGDMLKIKEIRVNCEQNSLLYLVEMMGRGACHAKDSNGKAMKSCYYRRIIGDGLEYVQGGNQR